MAYFKSSQAGEDTPPVERYRSCVSTDRKRTL